MGLLQQAKQGVLWSFLQQFSVQLINFGVQIFLARLLMPSDFGLIAMIAVFVAVGQSLSDSGMTSSLIRNEKNSEEDYGTVFLTNLAISCLVYVIVYFCAPFVALFYEQDILTSLLRIYATVFIISSFSAVQIAKFTKELDFKSQFAFQLPSVIIGAVVGIVMAFNNYGVWSLIGLNITQSAVFTLFLLIFYKWRPKLVFDKKVFGYHFDYGYKLTLSGLLNTVYLNLYKIIIGKNFSPANVGFFTQADSLRLFPVNQLSSVLNKVTYPLFASIQNDDGKLREAYKSALRLVLSLTAALMLVLILIAEPLFLIVFGEKWLPSVPYFKILCIASIFLPIGTYNLNILKVKGRSDLFLKVEVIKKCIGVSALLLCVPFGIEAMVWSLCITNICFAYINGYFSGKLINYSVKAQILNSLNMIVLAVIPAICCYYIGNYFLKDLNGWLKIIIIGIVYGIIYLPLVMFFNKALMKDIKIVIKR